MFAPCLPWSIKVTLAAFLNRPFRWLVIVVAFQCPNSKHTQIMGDAKLLLLTVSVLVLGLVQSAPYSGSEKAKRPFCNAFTGCGRKRSDPLVNALSGVDSDYSQMESSYQVRFFKDPFLFIFWSFRIFRVLIEVQMGNVGSDFSLDTCVKNELPSVKNLLKITSKKYWIFVRKYGNLIILHGANTFLKRWKDQFEFRSEALRHHFCNTVTNIYLGFYEEIHHFVYVIDKSQFIANFM